MPEGQPKRITFEVTPAEHTAIVDEAARENITIKDLVKRSFAIRRLLRGLEETGLTFILQNSQGDQILNMPTSLFVTFLEGDPRLVEYFTRENPKS